MEQKQTSKSADYDPWAVDPDETATADVRPYSMSGALSGWETDEDKISAMALKISIDSRDFDEVEARAREMTLDDLVWDIPPESTTTDHVSNQGALENSKQRPSGVTNISAHERIEMTKLVDRHVECDDELCHEDEVDEPVEHQGRARRKDQMTVPLQGQHEQEDAPSQSHKISERSEQRDQSSEESIINKPKPNLAWSPDTQPVESHVQKRHHGKLQGRRRNYLTHPTSGQLAGETSPEQVQPAASTRTKHAGSRVRTYSKKIKFRRTRSWHEGEA